ncbi:MAG: hypothetical protein KC550_06250, partial [Nanoarchaeota archaeon]|nr:hypothetical protein [Nanoarchaeota archaeon]
MKYLKKLILGIVFFSCFNLIFGVQTNTSAGISLEMDFYFDASTNDYEEFYNIDLSKFLAKYSDFSNEVAYYNFSVRRVEDMNFSINYGSTMSSNLCNGTTTNNGSFYCSFNINDTTKQAYSTSFAVCNENGVCSGYGKFITNNQSKQVSAGITLSNIVSFGENMFGTYVFPTENNGSHLYNQSWVYINVSSTHIIDVCQLNWEGSLEVMNKSADNMFCYLNKTSLANGSYNYFVILNSTSSAIEGSNTT